jgi:hypothetical protein
VQRSNFVELRQPLLQKTFLNLCIPQFSQYFQAPFQLFHGLAGAILLDDCRHEDEVGHQAAGGHPKLMNMSFRRMAPTRAELFAILIPAFGKSVSQASAWIFRHAPMNEGDTSRL